MQNKMAQRRFRKLAPVPSGAMSSDQRRPQLTYDIKERKPSRKKRMQKGKLRINGRRMQCTTRQT